MIRLMRAMAFVSAAALVAAALGPAEAQIYRWTDERGTSHYVDGLDNVPERYRSQAAPLGLRNKPAPPASKTEGAGDGAPAGGATIRFTPGKPIFVDARVNGTAPVRLVLDTGADRTLLSPRALAAAGVSLTRGTRSGQIVGVTGTAEIQVVVIDSLEVGAARVGRLAVSAHDMSDPGHDGLLGRDFLDQFNVSIDSGRGVVTLTPK